MRSFRRYRALATLAAAALISGCSATTTAQAAPDFDRPVPPEVPRDEVRLLVDLEPAQDCEERFDLALYEDRAIDLIAWDDGVGSCVNRTVTIRYLPERTDRQKVLGQVRELTRRMEQKATATKEGATKGGERDDRS